MINVLLDTYDNNEAAKVIGCSPSTLNTWRTRGKGPKFHRIAGRIRYFKTDVQEYIESQINGAVA